MSIFRLLCLLFALSYSSLPQAQVAPFVPELSTEEIHLAVRNIARELHDHYVSPTQATVAATQLLAKLTAGDFNGQYDFALLNHQITQVLTQATANAGFELLTPQGTALLHSEAQGSTPDRQHDAFTAGILQHNIGYLNITGHYHYPDGPALLAEQMRLLEGVDALIIDLRAADEASIAVALQLMSYFVEPGTQVAKIQFNRHAEALYAGSHQGFAQLKPEFPLYIVNSAFVAGTWEFFGYSLQQLKKATIVGEPSMGYSQIPKVVRISDHLALKMNYAIITHPTLDENWDNQGVVPDYFYASEQAFLQAQRLAVQRISALPSPTASDSMVIKAQVKDHPQAGH